VKSREEAPSSAGPESGGRGSIHREAPSSKGRIDGCLGPGVLPNPDWGPSSGLVLADSQSSSSGVALRVTAKGARSGVSDPIAIIALEN
jgi:hypothetical protein